MSRLHPDYPEGEGFRPAKEFLPKITVDKFGRTTEIEYPPSKQPIVTNLREIKKDINLSNDDLRELLVAFLKKLKLVDLKYALLTMETEYERRKFGVDDVA